VIIDEKETEQALKNQPWPAHLEMSLILVPDVNTIIEGPGGPNLHGLIPKIRAQENFQG
jgi:hypothetical protein